MKANCFICNREIGFIFEEHDDIPNEPDHALSTKIAGGYGSSHDGMYGTMYVCDPCFGDRIDRLENVGDYLEDAANASDVLIEAGNVVEIEFTKLQHPSNKSFWENIQNKYWKGE